MLPTPPASPSHDEKQLPEVSIGQILFDQIRITEILGHGAYGVVYKGVDLRTGVEVAIKALNKTGLDPRQRRFQKREISLHQQVSQHPNVLSVFHVEDTKDCTYVFLEYCSEGDLFVNITDRGVYVGNDALAKNAFLQILDAVSYCHAMGVYHRDLKPENILVANHGMDVKLADFGLATKDFVSSDFGCGSTFYMSPECQERSPKPFSCYASGPNDIWSLGVILVNLTCGRNPWKRASSDDSTFNAYMRNPDFLKTILPLSDDLNDILKRIFHPDPSARISIADLRTRILNCRAFTEQAPAPRTVLPATGYAQCYAQVPSSELQVHIPADGAYCSAYQQPIYASQLPSPPPDYLYSDGSDPSDSDPDDYEYSPISSLAASPAPSVMQYNDAAEAQPHQVSAQTFLSPNTAAASASAWFTNFMPTFDLTQKHVSFHPLIPGMRLF